MARLTRPLFLMAGAALLALGIADTEGLSATGSTKGFFRLQATRDSWSSLVCTQTSAKYAISSGYAECEPFTFTAYNIPTSCFNGTLYYPNTDPVDCGTAASCYTRTVYESNVLDPATSEIFCNQQPDVGIIFRQIPAADAKTTDTSTTTAAPSLTPGPPVTTSPPTATAAATDTNSDSSAQSNSDGDGDSDGGKAWIAGAVIGPVAGCAIIAALCFWLFRRGTKKGRQTALAEAGVHAPPVTTVAGGDPVEKDNDQSRAELPGS